MSRGARARAVVLLLAALLALPACGVGSRGLADRIELTPIVLRVARAPIPVLGSDARYHILYELGLTNMSRGRSDRCPGHL